MELSIESEIQAIVRGTLDTMNTKKIILFGSYANKTQNQDSDIDICIITNDKKRKIDLLRTLRKHLLVQVNHPMDLLIYTENEFYEKAHSYKGLENTILEKGITLYE